MAAMYTKMTATGSSLIVAPRTISKELEAKIATAIASVIATHDLAKLSTKVVRQFVEKEVHVSLTNHKEVLKRLMHQEVRRIKAEKAAKRPAPQPWKIKTRRQCMIKGIHYVYALLRDSPATEQPVKTETEAMEIDRLALHVMQTLFDLHLIEGFDVAHVASTYMRMLAASYLQKQQLRQQQPQPSSHAGEWPVGRVPTPSETLQCLVDVYTLERIGASHPRRVELLEFLDRSPPVYSVSDYLGWNPMTEGPPPSPNRFRSMTDALLKCWYAHSLQVSLGGCAMVHVLQYLPHFYPYKSPSELSTTEYRDQTRMVTTLVMVLTGFGKLRCETELLPHEYFYLRQHLVVHLVRQDIPLLAEMLRALRCFDGADNLISVRRAMTLLMLSQQADGSWSSIGTSDSTTSNSSRAHTTLSALVALTESRTQGFAPSIPNVQPLLELNLNAELPAVVVEDEKLKKEAAASVPPPLSAVEESNGVSSPENGSASDTTTSTSASAAGPSPRAMTAAEEESLEEQVRFHQGLLEKAGENVKNVSAALAQQVLTTLSGMALNVDILKNTGVGRTINKLRKHSSEEVATAATQLVAQWKKDLL